MLTVAARFSPNELCTAAPPATVCDAGVIEHVRYVDGVAHVKLTAPAKFTAGFAVTVIDAVVPGFMLTSKALTERATGEAKLSASALLLDAA